LGLASLVLGILALALSWVLFAGVALGTAAVGVGIVARRRGASNDGGIVAGILMGSLAIVIGVVLLAFQMLFSFSTWNSG
jgi:hypothetical protein